ncbi:hypothetical protein H0H92_013033, partial [Tricholoma furcatifolium]
RFPSPNFWQSCITSLEAVFLCHFYSVMHHNRASSSLPSADASTEESLPFTQFRAVMHYIRTLMHQLELFPCSLRSCKTYVFVLALPADGSPSFPLHTSSDTSSQQTDDASLNMLEFFPAVP